MRFVEVDFSSEVIFGKYLNKFVDFCFQISDKVELVDNHSDKITCEEFEAAKHLHRFQKFHLQKRQVTNKTHCTLGGAAVVYTFSLEDNLKACFMKMEDIFQPIHLCEDDFYLEDPAFYQDNRLIVTICSHEKYGTMYLSEEEYRQFREYQIPHFIREDSWWLEKQTDDLHTVNVIISERSILGGLLGPCYVDEFTTWEDKQKIYSQYHSLPIQYVSVEEIIIKLKERYQLKRFYSKEIEEQIRTNIRCNENLAKYLKRADEMLIELYQIEYKRKELFIGVEKVSGYLVVDSFETLNKIRELRKEQIDIQQECFYSFIFYDFESKEEVYPKECKMLCDEISLIRGLDEFEQRKVECINYYDRIRRRVQSGEYE